MADLEEELEDLKIYLRCSLGACAGTLQSRVSKEYYDQTQERLDYTRFGFTHIYDFLVSLEGDVCRLEFSPKDGENLVYVVLDTTKFASAHLKKYANKTTTGLKHKSPAEVDAWRREQEQKGIAPPPLPSDKRKQGRQRNAGRKGRKGGAGGGGKGRNGGAWGGGARGGNSSGGVSAAGSSIQQPPIPSPANEWEVLSQILPGPDNKFPMKIRAATATESLDFAQRELLSYFSIYNVSAATRLNGVAIITFPSYFTAYRAWKEKNLTVMYRKRICVEPIPPEKLDLVKSGFSHVIVTRIPAGFAIQQMVTKFTKFNNLVSIQYRPPPENCALVFYSKNESAARACTENVFVTIDGAQVRLNVVMGGDDGANGHNVTPYTSPMKPGILPTPTTPISAPDNHAPQVCIFVRSCNYYNFRLCIQYD